MSTVTIKGQLLGYHFDHMPEGKMHWSYQTGAVMEVSGTLLIVMPHNFEAEVPDDLNIVAMQVAALESEREKLGEEFRRSVAQINERLSRLQATEYTT